MTITIAEIAEALGARFEGDGALTVTGAAAPGEAGPADLAMATDPRYAAALAEGRARAAVLWDGADWRGLNLDAAIFVTRPRYAMAGVTAAFERPPAPAPGIHPSAVVESGAEIDPGAAIGPFTLVGAGARIGPRARILGHVSIGDGARIGADALLHAGVRVGARVAIGVRFIAQPGAVIGADGFSFVTPEPGAIEEVRRSLGDRGAARQSSYARIASLGSVRIGDDVEIGANSTIDRGTLSDTVIGDGTKVDNLVQIGHNVVIGRDCLICGQVGIAGSTVIGDRVVLAGQCGVADHLQVGDDVIAGAASIILSRVPAGRVVMGYPAMKMDANIEAYKALRRLPRLMRDMVDRQKRVSKRGETE